MKVRVTEVPEDNGFAGATEQTLEGKTGQRFTTIVKEHVKSIEPDVDDESLEEMLQFADDNQSAIFNSQETMLIFVKVKE